ncbi:hypothetical protein E2C01_013486 [Portunus trituberculatus]|uniref:Uncharacterized protein n=1 Tax=Portunus trituberculatus TaxID=210409 RepID=A0A5B7DGR5_PORTR|nr:hypothetical protein [Portunus trituberculatus]
MLLRGAAALPRAVRDTALIKIELQWMVMSCDPSSPERETCDELPQFVQVDSEQVGAQQCEVVCPRGPPGLNGTDVRHHTSSSLLCRAGAEEDVKAQPKSKIWWGRERTVCQAHGVLPAPQGCEASQDHWARMGNVASLDSL